MANIEDRLDSIEKNISQIKDNLSSPGSRFSGFIRASDREIDVKKFFGALWEGKWIFFLACIFSSVVGIFYSLALPNKYKSEGIYAAAQQQTNSTLLEQYGGLAAMAGINIGPDQGVEINQALALVKSWPFIESFINKYELKPYLKAVKRWREKDQKIDWDEKIYDAVSNKWMLSPESGMTFEPTSFESYKSFNNKLQIDKDTKTGLVTIAIEYSVPELSNKWVGLLVDELNQHYKNRDMYEARRNIEYLEKKILETSIAEMQSVFYGLIEDQTKKLMLAEVRSEYLIQTVVPPKVAEQKSKPRRLVIVLLATLSGLVLSFCFLLWRFLRQELKF